MAQEASLLQAVNWDVETVDDVRRRILSDRTAKQAAVMPHIGAGLLGAGLGSVAGLIKEYLSLNKRKRYAENAITGGLLGGLTGAGGSWLLEQIREGKPADTDPSNNTTLTPEAIQERNRAADRAAGVFSPEALNRQRALAEAREQEVRNGADYNEQRKKLQDDVDNDNEHRSWLDAGNMSNNLGNNLLRIPGVVLTRAGKADVSTPLGLLGAGVGAGSHFLAAAGRGRNLLQYAVRQGDTPAMLKNMAGDAKGFPGLAEHLAQAASGKVPLFNPRGHLGYTDPTKNKTVYVPAKDVRSMTRALHQDPKYKADSDFTRSGLKRRTLTGGILGLLAPAIYHSFVAGADQPNWFDPASADFSGRDAARAHADALFRTAVLTGGKTAR